MIQATLTLFAFCTVVVDATWKGFCEESPNMCSDYCSKNPEACKTLCDDDPSINGCGPNYCCDAETAKCLACKAGVPIDEYCETNSEVTGCCKSDCKKVHHDTLVSEKKCRTRVRDQVAMVHRPVFLEMNIEKDCPIGDWFMHNIELCEQCSTYHKPCNNTHMACGGCCGTPWHSQLGLNINVEHTCEDIKQIFLSQNTHTAECDVEEADDDDSEPGEITFADETPEKHWLDEVITAKCTSDIHQVVCLQSPLKVKFECDECQNQGSPVLMRKCCDRCVEFAEKLASNTKIPDFVKPIVWCSSCDDEYIYPEDTEKYSAMPWPDHKKYANYTELKADEQFEAFIDNHICTQMRTSCPAEDRRLRGLSDDSSTCLSSTKDCDTQGELYEDAANGRRLLDREKVAQVSADAEVEVTDKNPELVCTELGSVVDPGRYAKNSVTVEHTVTATTVTAATVTVFNPSQTTTMSPKLGNSSDGAAGSVISLSTSLAVMSIPLLLV